MLLFKIKLSLLLLFLASIKVYSQNTGISDVNRTPDPSAVLDVFSTSKGILAPRMTEAERAAIASPATGLLVYQTNGTAPGFYYYTGTTWTPIASGSGSQWLKEFSTTNIYYNSGFVGVGVTSPSERLDIGGNLKFSGAFMPGNQAGADGTVLQSKGTGVAPVWVDLISPTNTYNWSLGGNNLISLGLRNFGTTSNTDIPVITNSFERMRITAAGNIGIGTAAPASPLHISTAAGGNLLYLQSRAGGPGSSAGIMFKTYGDVAGATGNPTALINAIDDGNFSNHITLSTKIGGADANALAERVRIASNGNVGIGLNNPIQKLDVTGNFKLNGAFMPNGTAGTTGYVLQSSGDNASPTWVDLSSATNTFNWSLGGNNLATLGIKNLGTTSNTDLPFITNGSEKMRLNTAGYLGLGTTAPASKVHVVTSSGTGGPDDDHTFDAYTGTGAGATTVYYRHSRGTATSRINLVNGDQLLDIVGNGYINGTFANSSSLRSYYAGTGTENLSYLTLGTSNLERMRISPTGNVGIGTTTFDATNPEKLFVNTGTAANATTSVNAIVARGNINKYYQTNIQNLSNGTQASSDIVATADNGTESTFYVNLGINGSGFVYNPLNNAIQAGAANDGYLLSAGRNFHVVNSSANDAIIFTTGGTATSNEAMRITAARNIGIGVTAPFEKLELTGNFRLNGAFMPGNNAGAVGSVLQSNGSGVAPIWVAPGASSNWALNGNDLTTAGIKSFGTTSSHDLPFITNGAEKMRITAAGNVGIGITPTTDKLEVEGNIKISGPNGGTRRLTFENSTAAGSIGGGDPDGIIELRAVANNEQQEMLFYLGNDNTTTYGPDRIRMVSEEFRFQTFGTDAGTITTAESQSGVNTRLFINTAGSVGVNTVTPTSTLSVNGSLSMAVRTISGNTDILENDHVVISTGGTAVNWTLPIAAAANRGRIYRLVNHGPSALTLSQLVTVGTGNNTSNLSAGTAFEIISDGAAWRKIN